MSRPVDVFHLIADRPGAVWLDGGDAQSGWSILSFEPIEIVTKADDWQAAGRAFSRPYPTSNVPFQGGAIGYIGYGAGHAVSPVPECDSTWEPDVWLGHYPGALCYEHRTQRWHCTGPKVFQQEATSLLDAAQPAPPAPNPPRPTAHHTMAQSDFVNRISRIHELLRQGDCYQINLTRAVWLEGVGDAWAAYRRMRATSAPQFAAFLRLNPSLTILCNSPELLLDYHCGIAKSEPIKGTRPRGLTSEADAALVRELMDAPKDQAELTMIVDLVRNDLGRIAKLGTVQTSPRTIRSHANVHHASQCITAELTRDDDPWSTLGVLFPPGSVTGAPKIRACQRIHELEIEPRGVYCGAIGYASGQRSIFNVAIRTAIWNQNACRFHVGGGIVIDSNPLEEWRETIHKAAIMAKAFGLDNSAIQTPSLHPEAGHQ